MISARSGSRDAAALALTDSGKVNNAGTPRSTSLPGSMTDFPAAAQSRFFVEFGVTQVLLAATAAAAQNIRRTARRAGSEPRGQPPSGSGFVSGNLLRRKIRQGATSATSGKARFSDPLPGLSAAARGTPTRRLSARRTGAASTRETSDNCPGTIVG